MTETVSTGASSTQGGTTKGKGLTLERVFSTEGTHPMGERCAEREHAHQQTQRRA